MEIILLAVGLSMDAVAVSICNGMKIREGEIKYALTMGAVFGIFQGVMPLIGYILGDTFINKIQSIDHWIAFGLLAYIGFNMLKEGLSKEEKECSDLKLSTKQLILQGIATSIDALAVGISFAVIGVNIYVSSGIIAFITFALSAIAAIFGKKWGMKLGEKAEVFGGLCLFSIGLKILLEHTIL